MADSYSAIYNRYYSVADGTPVAAKIGGEMYTTAVAGHSYRITINQPSGMNYDGMAVDFMINNSLVGTGIWQSDKYVPVILTLTVSGSLEPTPMPTPMPTPPPQYTVTAFANPSTEGLVNPPSANVNYGESLMLMATPFRGYQLASWSGLTGYGTSLQVSFIVKSNMVIAANFEPIPFTERQQTVPPNWGVGFPPINMTKGSVLEGSLSVTGGNDMRFFIKDPSGTIVLDENPVQSTYTFSITAQSDGVYMVNLDNTNGVSTKQVSLSYRVY